MTKSLYSSFVVLYFAKFCYFCIAFVLFHRFHYRAHFVFLVAPLAHCPWPGSRRPSPVTSHRVNCSCVVSAEEKYISCSGQPLCNSPSARRSFLLKTSPVVPASPLSRAKLLCIRLSSTGHKSAPRKVDYLLSAHFPRRPHRQKAHVRPSTRATLTSTYNHCMLARMGAL